MSWEILLCEEVSEWFVDLVRTDPASAHLVEQAIDVLAAQGPTLGRPLADRVSRSRHHNMKELRPGSAGTSEVRILFAFDPLRQALLLVAGDKNGSWNAWYDTNIPIADKRFDKHLDSLGAAIDEA
ncbi:type II toxin-antitoxin system RelE/ParE family toxin [Streptomyces uncialis]|uniref:type II toxin-antitoxin system RelE/ParE family toxin n=1 Tax=Streptomyces uncialis TaxID=1048205 RepID=UPI002252F423|nr:type II toxin-antitoxin system RelE/ParE family toxin [Streptomyces uncialis]MCX4661051.1 type II toxin-antitoxin system RelE/ParE family toxin [Streptomyces uncialis]